jgi:hypothetical protein
MVVRDGSMAEVQGDRIHCNVEGVTLPMPSDIEGGGTACSVRAASRCSLSM